jgi:hypothetical protein
MCDKSPDDASSDDGHSRRRFIGYAAGALAAGRLSASLAGDPPPPASEARPGITPAGARSSLIWGNLLHLGYNMWSDRPTPMPGLTESETYCRPYLRFDDRLWEDLTKHMAGVGMNMVVIDLGDGVQYRSHPEIAVRGAWSAERLHGELARLRGLGLEPIPKLNFSTGHDIWLHEYSRQVSTPIYYKVCEELIDEVIRLFERPRFFHLGYDEETMEAQATYSYVVVRQHELWWHDFAFFAGEVDRRGVRPWIWSDYAWRHADEFLKRMPKSVLQSNWHYGLDFNHPDGPPQWYANLDRAGYDQMPTGSNWSSPKNFGLMVEHCRKTIAPARLKGFLQTTWRSTREKFRQNHLDAIDQVAAAMALCAEDRGQVTRTRNIAPRCRGRGRGPEGQ